MGEASSRKQKPAVLLLAGHSLLQAVIHHSCTQVFPEVLTA